MSQKIIESCGVCGEKVNLFNFDGFNYIECRNKHYKILTRCKNCNGELCFKHNRFRCDNCDNWIDNYPDDMPIPLMAVVEGIKESKKKMKEIRIKRAEVSQSKFYSGKYIIFADGCVPVVIDNSLPYIFNQIKEKNKMANYKILLGKKEFEDLIEQYDGMMST